MNLEIDQNSSMDVKPWKVTDIGEADYGCEERAEDVGAMALVTMADAAGNRREREIPEAVIARTGIDTGSWLCIDDEGTVRRYLHVAAAVIVKDHRVFAAERGHGFGKDGWEFPGGKIEDGETPEEACVREIREELKTGIAADSRLITAVHVTDTAVLQLECCACHLLREDAVPVLTEHEDSRWLSADTLDTVDWLPADRKILPAVRRLLAGR